MKAELPELKQCCFCIPLRPGLLVWGYLRLVFLILVITSIILLNVHDKYPPKMVLMPQFIYMLAMMGDACLTIVYLIGGHQRKAKLLYVSFIGNIVLLCVHTLVLMWATWNQLYLLMNLHAFEHLSLTEKLELSKNVLQGLLGLGIFTLGTITYVIILLKSEINKIKNSSNGTFANNPV